MPHGASACRASRVPGCRRSTFGAYQGGSVQHAAAARAGKHPPVAKVAPSSRPWRATRCCCVLLGHLCPRARGRVRHAPAAAPSTPGARSSSLSRVPWAALCFHASSAIPAALAGASARPNREENVGEQDAGFERGLSTEMRAASMASGPSRHGEVPHRMQAHAAKAHGHMPPPRGARRAWALAEERLARHPCLSPRREARVAHTARSSQHAACSGSTRSSRAGHEQQVCSTQPSGDAGGRTQAPVSHLAACDRARMNAALHAAREWRGPAWPALAAGRSQHPADGTPQRCPARELAGIATLCSLVLDVAAQTGNATRPGRGRGRSSRRCRTSGEISAAPSCVRHARQVATRHATMRRGGAEWQSCRNVGSGG